MTSDLITALSAFGGAAVACVGFGFWISNYFYGVKESIGERIDDVKTVLFTKIEAHETLDNERFDGLKDRISKQDLVLMRIELSTGSAPHMVGRGGTQ